MNSAHREQVNHPDHYNQGNIECIDALEAALGLTGYEGFCIGNALKYLWRAPHKGVREQDLRKARWYIDRLLPAHQHDVSTGAVEREVTGADVIDWADGIRGTLGTEHASKVTAQEARIADAIVKAMPDPSESSCGQNSEIVSQEMMAIGSTLRFVDLVVKPRGCDSDGASGCWRCQTVYLASVVRRMLPELNHAN